MVGGGVGTGGGSSRWRLRADRIPGHISYSMAEKIFFVGESIQLFESAADSKVGSSSHPENNVKDVLRDEEVRLYNQLVSKAGIF